MAKQVDPISHWHHSVEGFNTSALDFFQAIEATFTAKEAPVRPARVEYHEENFATAKREYLRISHGRYSADISAFPFGKDFYFSWWLGRRVPSALLGCLIILGLPVLFLLLLKVGGFAFGTFFFLLILGAGLFTQLSTPGQSEIIEAMDRVAVHWPALRENLQAHHVLFRRLANHVRGDDPSCRSRARRNASLRGQASAAVT